MVKYPRYRKGGEEYRKYISEADVQSYHVCDAYWNLYNHHTDPAKPYDALHCVPAVKLEEVFKICHEGVAGGHRGLAGTLDKFQRTFFTMSSCEAGGSV